MKWWVIFLLCITCVNALQVNEIMYNPKSADLDKEFVELYNPNNEIIDFEELWMIGDDKYWKRIQDYSGWNNETNASYIIITSCYSDFYEYLDNDLLFNPISMAEWDDSGEPVCDKIGNNLKNTKDYIEIWFCPSGIEEQDCVLKDFVEYNESMGADGNGNSLQLINNTWVETIPTPGKVNRFFVEKNTKITVNIEEFLVNDIDYENLFKIKIKDKDCRIKENITVIYNIANEDLTIDWEDEFTVEIGCSKSSGTGEMILDAGNYTLCGYVLGEKDVKDCLNFQVIDTAEIIDDIILSINLSGKTITYPDSIRFYPELNNETYPYKIDYWFEDIDGKLLKKKVTTLNTNRKSYKPNVKIFNTTIIVKTNLSYIGCNDSNHTNNIASKTINYICNIQDNDIFTEVCLNGDCKLNEGIMKYPYSKLFKITNNGYTPCMDTFDVDIEYNITSPTNNFDNGTISNSLTKSKKFGSYTFNEAGRYTVCIKSIFNDTNLSNNIQCKELEIIDTSSIPCSVKLDMDVNELHTSGESVKYKVDMDDKSFPYVIQYWIEDLFGNEIKTKKNSTNTNQRSFTKTINEEDRIYIIKSELAFLACNDSNLSDNYIEQFILINGTEYTESSGGSAPCNIAIEKVYVGTDNNVEWGEVFKVKTVIYKNDTGKTAMSAYIVDSSEKKVSQQTTSFNLHTKNQEYELTIPLQLKPNCKEKYNNGKYTIVINGLGKEIRGNISVEGRNSLCSETSTSSSSSNNKFAYYIDSSPSVVSAGEEFSVKVKLDNDENEGKEIEAHAFVYKGSKSYSGERMSNLQTISLSEETSTTLGLSINLDNEIKEGIYKIKVRLRIDGQKTYKELIKNIEIKNEKTEIKTFEIKQMKENSAILNAEIDGNDKYDLEVISFLQEHKKSTNDNAEFEVKLFEGKNMFFLLLKKGKDVLDIEQLEITKGNQTTKKIEQTAVAKTNKLPPNPLLKPTKTLEEPKTVYKSNSKRTFELVPHILVFTLTCLCTILIIKAKNL